MRRRRTITPTTSSYYGAWFLIALLSALIIGNWIFTGVNRGSITALQNATSTGNQSLVQMVQMNKDQLAADNLTLIGLLEKDMVLMSNVSSLDSDITALEMTVAANSNSIINLNSKTTTLMAQVTDLQAKDMQLMDTDTMLQMEIDALSTLVNLVSNETIDLNQTLIELMMDVLMLEPEVKATWNQTAQNTIDIMALQNQNPVTAVNVPGTQILPSSGEISLTNTAFDANSPINIMGHSGNAADFSFDTAKFAQFHVSAGSGISKTNTDPMTISNTGVLSVALQNVPPILDNPPYANKNFITMTGGPTGAIQVGVRGEQSWNEAAPSKVMTICPGDNTFALGQTEIYWSRIQKMVTIQVNAADIGNFSPGTGHIISMGGSGNCDPTQGIIDMPYSPIFSVRTPASVSCSTYSYSVYVEMLAGERFFRMYLRYSVPAGVNCVFNGLVVQYPTND